MVLINQQGALDFHLMHLNMISLPLCVSQGLLCGAGSGPVQAQLPVGDPGEAAPGCQDPGGEDLFWASERG